MFQWHALSNTKGSAEGTWSGKTRHEAFCQDEVMSLVQSPSSRLRRGGGQKPFKYVYKAEKDNEYDT